MAPSGIAPDEEFSENAKKAIGWSLNIDVATSGILVQPNFEGLDGVPELQHHQKNSKSTATMWRDDVRASLFSVNDSILAYALQFDSFYKPLYEFAGQIDTNAEARKNLVLGLEELKKGIVNQSERTRKAGEKLKKFIKEMQTNEADLKGDQHKIESKYEGDKGVIDGLKTSIKAQEVIMATNMSYIALGSAGVIIGGLSIAVGVAGIILSGGLTTPLIVTGVVVAGGSAAGIVLAANNYSAAAEEKGKLQIKLADIMNEISVAENLRAGATTLVGYIQDAIDSADKLSRAWDQLGNDYDVLIETLNSTDPGSLSFIVQGYLETAKAQWENLAEHAKTLQKNLFEPPPVNGDTFKLIKSDQMRMLQQAFKINPDLSAYDVVNDVALVDYSAVNPSLIAAALSSKHTREAGQRCERAMITHAGPEIHQQTGLRDWVHATTRELYDFEHSLQDKRIATGAPNEVRQNYDRLKQHGGSGAKSVSAFLASVENLSRLAPTLESTARLSDEFIVNCALKEFQDFSSRLDLAKKNGKMVLSDLNRMNPLVMDADAAINGWLSKLRSEKDADEEHVAEFEKLRDEARTLLKPSNCSWHISGGIFGGVVTGALAAAELFRKMKTSEKKVDVLASELSKSSNSLSRVMSTWQAVIILGNGARTLVDNIDGLLKVIQILSVGVDAILASYSSTKPSILRANLRNDATQIDNLSSVRFQCIRTLLFRYADRVRFAAGKESGDSQKLKALSEETASEVLRDIQQLTSITMSIQAPARLNVSQPKLIYVDFLLRQNQELLVGHASEWLLQYSSQVVSVLARIRSLGNLLNNLLPPIREKIVADDYISATKGLEAVESSFDNFSRYLSETKIAVKSYLSIANDDQHRFKTVGEYLREKLVGEHGELQALENQEKDLATQLSQTLEAAMQASTKQILHMLKWGLILGATIAVGQIQFAAAEGAVLMNEVKKGANFVIKKVSDAGSAQAKKAIMDLNEEQNSVLPIIEQRQQTLVSISQLSSDIATLRILLRSVHDFGTNASNLSDVFDVLPKSIRNQIGQFYNIKILLGVENKDDCLRLLDASMDEWNQITAAAEALESTFYNSEF